MRATITSRFAAAALVAVFLATGAFTFWSNRASVRNTGELIEARSMSELYARESDLVSQTEIYVMLWLSTGDRTYLERKIDSDEAAALVMSQIGHSTRAEDQEFAAWAEQYFGPLGDTFSRLQEIPAPPVEELLAEYRLSYIALYDSVKRGNIGDTSLADRLTDPALVMDPSGLANPVPVIMQAKAAERQHSAALAMKANEEAERFFSFLAPVLYGSATVLVIILLAVGSRLGRREARAAAENNQLRRLTTTDALTNLGNRRGFEEATKRLGAGPTGGSVSLIMMDLDEFKIVNDTFGHARGDAVLSTFADLLRRLAPPGAGRFRIGGDEFALILHGMDGAASLKLAEHLRVAAADVLGSGVTVCAGVALLDPDSRDESLLLQQADAALYECKMRGRNLAVLWAGDTLAAPLFPASKLQAVRRLLEEGRIDAVFQPIWDLHFQSLLGYEGLSRPHPDYGLDGPQQAFGIAEQFGHSADLDRLCRNHLLAAASALPGDCRLFINLSPYSLTHQSFSPATLLAEIAAAGVAQSRLVFEITELSNVPTSAIAEAVLALRSSGFSVALDDVGAGNNGLEMLRKVSFDYVKIDRGVILAASESGNGRAGLMAILAFASESGAIVVAEGIEDADMFNVVREVAAKTSLLGKPGLIHGVQGYLFGRPLPPHQTLRKLPPVLAA